MRQREAPSDARTAISWLRADARIRSMFAAFAQAISSTMTATSTNAIQTASVRRPR